MERNTQGKQPAPSEGGVFSRREVFVGNGTELALLCQQADFQMVP